MGNIMSDSNKKKWEALGKPDVAGFRKLTGLDESVMADSECGYVLCVNNDF